MAIRRSASWNLPPAVLEWAFLGFPSWRTCFPSFKACFGCWSASFVRCSCADWPGFSSGSPRLCLMWMVFWTFHEVSSGGLEGVLSLGNSIILSLLNVYFSFLREAFSWKRLSQWKNPQQKNLFQRICPVDIASQSSDTPLAPRCLAGEWKRDPPSWSSVVKSVPQIIIIYMLATNTKFILNHVSSSFTFL